MPIKNEGMPERRVGFRVFPASAMDALVDRVQRLNAGLLVVSPLDTLVQGASTSAELTRDVLRALAHVAVERRIAFLVVHDAPRGVADPVARAIFETASIVFALASRAVASPAQDGRDHGERVRAIQLRAHRIVTPTLSYDYASASYAPAPRVHRYRGVRESHAPLPFPRESRRAARDR